MGLARLAFDRSRETNAWLVVMPLQADGRPVSVLRRC